jgi:hypothetical protein
VSTSPEPTLHVVLTCTKRKRKPAPDALQLRSYRSPFLEARLQAWLQTLQGAADPASAVSAQDLYAGDHWQVGCSLPAHAAARGVAARLWVCSAGYGLVPFEASLAPYSATFSRGHPDSVWRAGEGISAPEAVRRWWEGLGAWVGPSPGAPRTLRGLAAREPGAGIWVVASPTYLDAMRADLQEAAGVLERRDSLVLISAGTDRLEGLEENLLRFDWRLQGSGGVIRGAAMSLNVRVARQLLQGGWEPSVEALNHRVQTLSREIPPREPKVGRRVPPEQVVEFVRAELALDPAARATPLLRKLRDELGWAFEEKRFRRLVEDVRSDPHRRNATETAEMVR